MLGDYQDLVREDIFAVLAFAARLADVKSQRIVEPRNRGDGLGAC